MRESTWASRRIGWAALAALAAGCAAPPVPVAPAALERRPAARPSAPARPALPRDPLTLDQALALAVDRNPDLRAAARRIDAADAEAVAAASAFYPEVGARLSYTRTDNPAQAFGMIVAQRRFSPSTDVNDPGATGHWRPEVVARFALFRGFQDLHGLDAAKTGVELAALEREAVRNALGRAVSDVYCLHLAARRQVEVAAASVKAVESELRDARARFEAGALLKSDVLSLEVRLAAAKDAEVRARTGIEHVRTSLGALLALEPGESPELATDLPPEDASLPRDREAALARAFEGRPELRAAAGLVSVRASQLAGEQGAWLPRVDAFGSYGQDAPDLDFSRDQDNWIFGLSLDLPLFSGFRTRGRVAAARSRLEEARILQEKARAQVQQEVRDALLRREEASERIGVAERAVEAAEEALRLVRAQYQAGGAPVTRYLEAEAALADARFRDIASRTDLRRAEAELRRAVGGWK